jgi:hypothetical protein
MTIRTRLSAAGRVARDERELSIGAQSGRFCRIACREEGTASRVWL